MLRNEPEELGPQVALVFDTAALARSAEGLTGTASCPHFSVVGPSGEPERVAPDADPGEEVTLRESDKLAGIDFDDTSFIHVPRSYVARSDQIAKPLRSERIDLVVICSQADPLEEAATLANT